MAKSSLTPSEQLAWKEFREELYAQSDRAAAIMASAALQDFLKHRIVASFTNTDDKSVIRLLAPDGAIGTFGAQITLAYALDLIGPNLRKDLDTIRDIRNKFAHVTQEKEGGRKPASLSFTSQRIAQLCGKLCGPKYRVMKRLGNIWTVITSRGVDITSSRERYIAKCLDLTLAFVETTHPNHLECRLHPGG